MLKIDIRFFGGRGASSGAMTQKAKDYKPYTYGQITKFEVCN